MDFRHLIVTCLFSMLRLSFETQKIKENYAIFLIKTMQISMLSITRSCRQNYYAIKINKKDRPFLHGTRNGLQSFSLFT